MISDEQLDAILESALFAAAKPLNVDQLQAIFEEHEVPTKERLRASVYRLQQLYSERTLALREVASGYRFQVREEYGAYVARLWEEKPGRYSRALMETLAIIAYRQPITRGEIEDIRGVAVSTQIVRTLMERDWIRTVGHRDVPGRPALFATTKQFLDYFGLTSLNELPTLAELKDIEGLNAELELAFPKAEGEADKADVDTDEPHTPEPEEHHEH